jgi:hypothetical protein
MRIDRTRAARRLGLRLAIVVSIGACRGGATVQATPVEAPMTPAGSPSSARTARPDPTSRSAAPATPRPAATEASATFESALYPYAITLPPGIQLLNWKAATRPWDGVTKLERAVNPYADRTTIAEGGLYIFGDDDPSLETWFARVEGNGTKFHGCTVAENRVDVTVGGLPAIAFTQTCLEGTNMARVALWNDGFGIGVWLGETSADKLVAVRDRAVEILSTLEWRGR